MARPATTGLARIPGGLKHTGERDIDRVFVGGDLKVNHRKVLHQDMAEIEKEVSRRVAMK